MAPSKLIEDDEEQFTNNNETKRQNFPYEIVEVDPDVNKQLLGDFSGERTGFVQVGPKKYFFPNNYLRDAEHYYNFQVRPDDIWIVTFPRSGTTWMQEMVWLIANELDYETALEVPLNDRCPFLEFCTFVHGDVKAEFLKENSFCERKRQMVEEATRPEWLHLRHKQRRIIKTHLPFSLLPKNLLSSGCKVIYVARNPKDVIVSFYHLNKLFRTQGYKGNFAKYWEYFKRNLQPWTPYWEHIREGWGKRNEDNLLFVSYEDLNKDSRSGILNVAGFLNKQLTVVELDKLDDHLQIENFRTNKSVNNDILKDLGMIVSNGEGFIRKGRTGGWREEIDERIGEEMDEWIAENSKCMDGYYV